MKEKGHMESPEVIQRNHVGTLEENFKGFAHYPLDCNAKRFPTLNYCVCFRVRYL